MFVVKVISDCFFSESTKQDLSILSETVLNIEFVFSFSTELNFNSIH